MNEPKEGYIIEYRDTPTSEWGQWDIGVYSSFTDLFMSIVEYGRLVKQEYRIVKITYEIKKEVV